MIENIRLVGILGVFGEALCGAGRRFGPQSAPERKKHYGGSDTKPTKKVADARVESGQGAGDGDRREQGAAGEFAAGRFSKNAAVGVAQGEQPFARGADDGVAVLNAAEDGGARFEPAVEVVEIPCGNEHDGGVAKAVFAAECGEVHVLADSEAVGLPVDGHDV